MFTPHKPEEELWLKETDHIARGAIVSAPTAAHSNP